MVVGLKAGVSIVDISPLEGLELAGYPHCPRYNTGVHDPIYASCIYMENGKGKLAMIAMDLLMLSKKYVKEIRRSASEKTGIPEGNIVLCCSHTHSGPWTSGRLDLDALERGLKPDSSYTETLRDKLVSLVTDAMNNSFSARIGVGKGYCGKEQGVGGNRRVKDGPADPEVWVIGIQDLEGRWRGCFTKYALHPTLIHSDSTVVSADFPGYVREYLSDVKSDMVLLFAQGTSGDQSTRYYRNGQTFEEACRIGTAIGKEVDHVLNNMDLLDDVDLMVKTVEIDVDVRVLPEKAIAEENVRKAKSECERRKVEDAPYLDVWNAELKLLGAEDILGYILLHESGKKLELLVDEVPAEIQVVGIGDARVVFLQGEYFVEYGLRIKRESPFEKTFVVQLANGVLPGYVYTREALEQGGYETDTSMLSPVFGEKLVKKTVELLEETRKAGV